MIQPWMDFALGELTDHVSEEPGVANAERIVHYHTHTTLKARADSVPWCSAFVCCCFECGANIKSTRNAMARSWLAWPDSLVIDQHPAFGDVVVLWRGEPGSNAGHVGFFVTRRNGRVALLSGNSQNRVDVNWFTPDRVIGVRRLIRGPETAVA